MDHTVLDFLAEGCIAGQSLLRLVARGNAIIAELLRLSEHVPPVFEGTPETKRYEKLIFDFRYLKNADVYEHSIEESTELLDLDHEFRESNFELLHRFYVLFESVWKYVQDLNRYYDEIEEGLYIQVTLDMILACSDGKQLIAESLFLLGVMFIMLDLRITGIVRERLLTSYIRYKGQLNLPHIDEVCELMRTTTFNPPKNAKIYADMINTTKEEKAKKGNEVMMHAGVFPPDYPASFFKRANVSDKVVSMLLGRLRGDDIYNQLSAYPLPEHRSTALAQQGTILYIVLYFKPEVLAKGHAIMREIVDKFFPDNWVISFYLGYTVDLSIDWASFPAAKSALQNTVHPNMVKDNMIKFWSHQDKLMKELTHFLVEGILVDEYVLENTYKLLNSIREMNVSLRWLMLHSHTINRRLREIIAQEFTPENLLMLLLKTAQFEFLVKKIFQALLEAKEKNWESYKKQASDRMNELSDYFSGEKALTRVKKNENLQKWFKVIGTRIQNLDFTNSTVAGRRIQQLLKALEEVKEFHQIEGSIQVKEFLLGASEFLNQMVRVANVKEQFLVTMSLVVDFSYAWRIVENFMPFIHKLIQKEPGVMLMLRSLFLKLVSILDFPLLRIGQCNSSDLVSVSEFYSQLLVRYARGVLEIVPQNMFIQIHKIIKIQHENFLELPTKVEKEKIRDYAQFDQRYELSRVTHAISVFTEGILAMESTLIGVVQVDPKQLLEDGIRKELVKIISKTINHMVVFNVKKPSIQDFESTLGKLSGRLDGLLRSFQYIQDYASIYGLKIWQEEFTRIVNYYVEQECNSFLKKKVFSWQSEWQSEGIPIPDFPPVPGDSSLNFVGRIGNQLVYHTDPYRTLFLETMNAWFDAKTGQELISLRTFTLMMNSINVAGTSGLDKWVSFKTVQNLQLLMEHIKKLDTIETKSAVKEIVKSLTPNSTIPPHAAKIYTNAISHKKVVPFYQTLMSAVTRIGQMQLLRRQISTILKFSCRLDSNVLACSLSAMNEALLKDTKEHYLSPDTKPYPDEDLVADLGSYLDTTGLSETLSKIYITSQPLENFSFVVFLFVISQSPSFVYDKKLSTPVFRGRKIQCDFVAYVIGIITLLRQFHHKYTHQFLVYIGQYVRSYVNQSSGSTVAQPAEVTRIIMFLEVFTRYAGIPTKQLEEFIPPFVINTGLASV